MLPGPRTGEQVYASRGGKCLHPTPRDCLDLRKIDRQRSKPREGIFGKCPAQLNDGFRNAITTLDPRAVALAPVYPEATGVLLKGGQQPKVVKVAGSRLLDSARYRMRAISGEPPDKGRCIETDKQRLLSRNPDKGRPVGRAELAGVANRLRLLICLKPRPIVAP
ncbi:MAG: hypothetical protein EOO77_22740 [Oxalobacteraceae bacterium]|nr:MAG: hypothetical protein EOO77_22740 [Oxalobacteraceae bacterium]